MPFESVNVEVKMHRLSGLAAQSNWCPAHRARIALLPMAGPALVFVLAASFFPIAAQQIAEPPAGQITQPSAPSTSGPEAQPSSAAQQPGAGAQLRTGTSSGLDTDARLQNLLADHQFDRVQAQLSQLSPDRAQFYRGILANRSNQLEQSVQLLEPLVDQVTSSGNTASEKLLRMTLAEDYLRLGDWAKASQAYKVLDDRLHALLTPDERDEIEMPLKMLPLAKGNPPTTVDPCEPFRLQVSTDPLGLIDVPVFIDSELT